MVTNVYINIRGNYLAADDTNKEWNNFAGNTATDSISLNDENNVATGWTITLDVAASAADASGVNSVGSGDAVWVDESRISIGLLYTTNSSTPSEFRFSGLDNAKKYRIEIFGSRSSTNRIGDISIDGINYFSYDASNNSTLTHVFDDVSPTGGEITYYFKKNTIAAYTNAIFIQEKDGAATPSIIPQIMYNRTQMGN